MEDIAFLGSPDNPKTAGLVCYLSFIGWLIAYFALYEGSKSVFAAYQIRQTLLLHIITCVIQLLVHSFFAASAYFIEIAAMVGIGLFFLWLTGLFHAVNGRMRPIPLVGKTAQKIFAGL